MEQVRFTTGDGYWWNGQAGNAIDHPGTHPDSPLYPIHATEPIVIEGKVVVGYRTLQFKSEFKRFEI